MWVPASVTVKPLGFSGAVEDRRIIVFVKKQRNKDEETQSWYRNRRKVKIVHVCGGIVRISVYMLYISPTCSCVILYTHSHTCLWLCTLFIVSFDRAFHP